MCYNIRSYSLLNKSYKEAYPLKYWRGYLIAAIVAAITICINKLAAEYSTLVDMVYPYLTRTIQGFLAEWSGSFGFCLWQILLVIMIVLGLTSIVLMVVLRWNPFQWFGWILTAVTLVWFVNTCMYGLNNHAGPLSGDIRLTVTDYTLEELENTTVYFRDLANEYAQSVERDEAGNVIVPKVHDLSVQAVPGFDSLVHDHSYSVFAGCTLPVKELGWAKMYSAQGITGMTVGITGESAVNPETPAMGLPFAVCHEMSHRMCIAIDRDADLGAYLACIANPDKTFQYSGYFMAYRFCYNALHNIGTEEAAAAAARINSEVSDLLLYDLNTYSDFFGHKDTQTKPSTYIKDLQPENPATEDEAAKAAEHSISDLLVCWHIQEVVLPSLVDEEAEKEFDPYDETQVDLTDIVGAMKKQVMSNNSGEDD